MYNAKAFGSRPNDVVEDMLRRLPGIEVRRNGSIRALGEELQNVLVDGKECFGRNYTHCDNKPARGSSRESAGI